MYHFVLLFNRQGKCRLSKFYTSYTMKEKQKIAREVVTIVLARPNRMCNFVEWKDMKIIFKRYASLYFMVSVDKNDNELLALEVIHHYVESLDNYFGNVCELDLIYNFHKAYYILDEILMAGEIQETSQRAVLRMIEQADQLQENPEEATGE
ncbi:sigma adaptin [Pelomyxa schiedti]|nr:sigma adaptin [Pelomyxa schiedti]